MFAVGVNYIDRSRIKAMVAAGRSISYISQTLRITEDGMQEWYDQCVEENKPTPKPKKKE